MRTNRTLARVTERIAARSQPTREAYLRRLARTASRQPSRRGLPCANQAHCFAASSPAEKLALREARQPNLAILSAYNDLLSAHEPFRSFPDLIKEVAREAGAVAQFAGGIPAMCDGITQGGIGMELSLFSRDVAAMSAAVALSHQLFDGVLCLGVCDKIVPGLLIGALHFGHLPAIFLPTGPMPSGLPNEEKTRLRQLHAEGRVDRSVLLDAEARSYHQPGTCTFYGTANSNQLLLELMGLHLPGAAFVSPNTPLRDNLTAAATRRLVQITALGMEYTPVGLLVDERTIANAVVGLLATGGSTNHTIHLVAIARAAGLQLDWDDFSELSAEVPLLARIYPNGQADVNQFHTAGGTGFLIRELLSQGLLHRDVRTVAGDGGLERYTEAPRLEDGLLRWRPAATRSRDDTVLAPAERPFSPEGGLKLLAGNLGRAIIKTSAVKPEHRVVVAPAIVFHEQEEFHAAFEAGKLKRDLIAVVRFQGPRANGMPELHKLIPYLGALQDEGYHVGLVTDGRLSGASGKIPAAIHVTPEAAAGGPLAKLRDGDLVRLDAERGLLEADVEEQEWTARPTATAELSLHEHGMGRELFTLFRAHVAGAEEGAVSFPFPESSPAVSRVDHDA